MARLEDTLASFVPRSVRARLVPGRPVDAARPWSDCMAVRLADISSFTPSAEACATMGFEAGYLAGAAPLAPHTIEREGGGWGLRLRAGRSRAVRDEPRQRDDRGVRDRPRHPAGDEDGALCLALPAARSHAYAH